jgi:mannose-6-phosphate isomerase-like protein (cupin superfamily)
MSEIQIQHRAESEFHDEYGCAFRRILPWGRTGPSDTGMGVCVVAPGKVSTPHSHVDHEQFYVVRGTGLVHVDDQVAELGPGDALVVDSQRVHYFENISPTEDLELVSVWSMGPFGETS